MPPSLSHCSRNNIFEIFNQSPIKLSRCQVLTLIIKVQAECIIINSFHFIKNFFINPMWPRVAMEPLCDEYISIVRDIQEFDTSIKNFINLGLDISIIMINSFFKIFSITRLLHADDNCRTNSRSES